MSKRIVAGFLWFYTVWYAGNVIATYLGLSPVLGPVLGAAAGGFVVGDPFRIIWTRPAPAVIEPAPVETAPKAA
jgi:hypothetical protein